MIDDLNYIPADRKDNIIDNECDCSGKINYGVIQCKACNGCGDGKCNPGDTIIIQKRIQNQVRVYSTQYTDALGSMNVVGNVDNKPKNKFGLVNWHQMSDRAVPGIQTRYVPGKGGNSTRSSTTWHRPGSMGPAGKGVDIKYASYHRYLSRKKANNLKQGIPDTTTPTNKLVGNKTTNFGLIYSCRC